MHSASTDVDAVAALVDTLMNKKFYTIARVCSLRDWNFGNEHVTCGLYMLSRAGLWLDQGYFWLDPTNATTLTWITSVVLELKEMGFNEVMLADFRFPNSDQYIFDGDKDAALQDAASKLMGTCGGDNFTLSFGVADPAFAARGAMPAVSGRRGRSQRRGQGNAGRCSRHQGAAGLHGRHQRHPV